MLHRPAKTNGISRVRISSNQPSETGDGKGKPSRRWLQIKRILAWALALLFVVMIFGVTPEDEAVMRTFETAAWRWQNNPEYRSIAVEYCILADNTLRARPFLVRGPTLVMATRSLPFVPHQYAVNDTSEIHYSKFSGGPLVAYLFFCGEQHVDQFVGVLESVGRNQAPSQDKLLRFLDAFHMDYPVCTDAGARQSVATLIRDTRPGEPFPVRSNVGELLLEHVRGLARELNFPTEPDQMTPDQQQAVLVRLDDYVKQHDHQLWRTKQLNDFCCGVWAQVYGPHYHLIIGPVLALRKVGTWGVVLMLVLGLLRRERREPERAKQDEDELNPRQT